MKVIFGKSFCICIIPRTKIRTTRFKRANILLLSRTLSLNVTHFAIESHQVDSYRFAFCFHNCSVTDSCQNYHSLLCMWDFFKLPVGIHSIDHRSSRGLWKQFLERTFFRQLGILFYKWWMSRNVFDYCMRWTCAEAPKYSCIYCFEFVIIIIFSSTKYVLFF